MFNWPSHLKETADHIARMASMPGWVDHARLRLKELKDDPDYAPQYAEIAEMVRSELERLRARVKK